MKFNFLFFCLMIIQIACINKEYLSGNEYKLLPYYEGDTIIFKNNEGKSDSFLITERKINNFQPGDLSSKWFYRPLEAIIKFKKLNSEKEKGLIMVYKRQGEISYSLHFPNFYRWVDENDFNPSLKEFLVNKDSIVQVFESQKIDEQNNINKLYLNSKGIIKYETVSGKQWILQKKD